MLDSWNWEDFCISFCGNFGTLSTPLVHVAELDIDEGRATRRTKNGNDGADVFANMGN